MLRIKALKSLIHNCASDTPLFNPRIDRGSICHMSDILIRSYDITSMGHQSETNTSSEDGSISTGGVTVQI